MSGAGGGRAGRRLLWRLVVAELGRGVRGRSSGAPQETDFDRYKASAPVAVRYVRALAVGNMDTAHSLADQGNGAAANALTRLEQRVKAIPIAAAQVKPDYRSGIKQYGPDFATVPVTIQVKLSHAAPTEWVLLGKRDLLMHRVGRRQWRVVGDVTGRNGVVSGGMFLYTHPTLLSGSTRPSSMARDRRGTRRGRSFARWMRRRPGSRPATAARSQRSGRWRSSSNDRVQGEQLSGRDIGDGAVPLGTLDRNVLYIYLRPYQRASTIIRDSSMVYLMTLLAGRFNLFHAPWSLAMGVAGYEENEYLNTKGYILAARADPGCVPWLRQRRGLAVAGRELGAERRAPATRGRGLAGRRARDRREPRRERGDHPAGQAVQGSSAFRRDRTSRRPRCARRSRPRSA